MSSSRTLLMMIACIAQVTVCDAAIQAQQRQLGCAMAKVIDSSLGIFIVLMSGK